MIHSILHRAPVSAEGKQPHSMMMPPPTIFHCGCGVVWEISTKHIYQNYAKKSSTFVTSDPTTFCHMAGGFGSWAWMFLFIYLFYEKGLLSSLPTQQPSDVKNMRDFCHVHGVTRVCQLFQQLLKCCSKSLGSHPDKFSSCFLNYYYFREMSCSWLCHCGAQFSQIIDNFYAVP